MKNTLGASFVNDFTGGKIPIVPTPTPGEDIPIPSDGEVVIFDPTEPKEGDTPSEADIKEKIIERPVYTIIPKTSTLLLLPERIYGGIKRIGILNNQPILYGDINLLKQGQLYYISSAKQVYRFVKADTEYVYFTTIKPIKKDSGLLIPEEEKGTIKNAGYLFNEIIYSGDPNLVDNGLLFYHDTLPYISVISNVDGIINVSTKTIRFDGTTGTIINEYRVSTPHDYSKDYLTFEALEDGTFTLSIPSNINSNYMTSVSYSVDYGETWTTTNVDSTTQTITTPTITQGNKVLWKGVGKAMGKSDTTNNYSIFSATGNFNVKGNIMSMLYGDNFLNQVAFPSDSTYSFNGMFYNNKKLKSAESLILPATTLVERCYQYMFSGCAALTTAPVLPATTLADYCYINMFNGCSNLNYIKAMFTTEPSRTYTSNWVNGVAATGTFVKNSAATWNVTGVNGIPTGWTVETANADTNEITI